MFRKLIAIEFLIPEEYKDKEDWFMEQLLRQISQLDDVLIFDTPDKTVKRQRTLNSIFTGQYDFVDQIKGF